MWSSRFPKNHQNVWFSHSHLSKFELLVLTRPLIFRMCVHSMVINRNQYWKPHEIACRHHFLVCFTKTHSFFPSHGIHAILLLPYSSHVFVVILLELITRQKNLTSNETFYLLCPRTRGGPKTDISKCQNRKNRRCTCRAVYSGQSSIYRDSRLSSLQCRSRCVCCLHAGRLAWAAKSIFFSGRMGHALDHRWKNEIF